MATKKKNARAEAAKRGWVTRRANAAAKERSSTRTGWCPPTIMELRNQLRAARHAQQ